MADLSSYEHPLCSSRLGRALLTEPDWLLTQSILFKPLQLWHWPSQNVAEANVRSDWKGERIFLSLSLWCTKLEIFFPLVALRKHEWKRALDRGNKYTATLPTLLSPSLLSLAGSLTRSLLYSVFLIPVIHPIWFYLSVICSCRIFFPIPLSFLTAVCSERNACVLHTLLNYIV